ncbi:hypothetical protein [Streptomyces lydicus]|uniref:hypothetical protein n=1 Tax=Streptomyces lydicus TaxID=47763 RepID=UPI0037B6CE7B
MSEITSEVHLALSGRVTFEQGISVGQAAQVIGMLQSTQGRDHPQLIPEPPALPAPPAPQLPQAQRETVTDEGVRRSQPLEGPRQALDLSGARTYPEKVTALAAYLDQQEEHESFTQSDVRRLFQRARERIPSHFSREFDKAVRAGWIHEGETKGEHYLSEAAKDVVTTGFDDLRGGRGSQRKSSGTAARGSGRRKPRRLTVPDAFAEFDQIPSTIDGITPYHRIKLKRDKLLWTLKLAKELGIDGLQGPEVTWLTDKLGDAIPTRDMNGHFKGLRREAYASQSIGDRAMRITQTGEEYLETL